MKLDNKKTITVGFAFLAISAFWQVYDNIIPLILKYFFEIGDTASGAIMALDNIFALIMLPILDVYKRQLLRRCDGGKGLSGYNQMRHTGADPVSYTHLDVYKRQKSAIKGKYKR